MQAAVDTNPRYKADNIMTVELDMPERTTMDYSGPSVSARAQEALDAALRDEGDVVIGQSTDDFIDEIIRKKRREEKMASKRQRPGTAKGPKRTGTGRSNGPAEEFPSRRGLVK